MSTLRKVLVWWLWDTAARVSMRTARKANAFGALALSRQVDIGLSLSGTIPASDPTPSSVPRKRQRKCADEARSSSTATTPEATAQPPQGALSLGRQLEGS